MMTNLLKKNVNWYAIHKKVTYNKRVSVKPTKILLYSPSS